MHLGLRQEDDEEIGDDRDPGYGGERVPRSWPPEGAEKAAYRESPSNPQGHPVPSGAYGSWSACPTPAAGFRLVAKYGDHLKQRQSVHEGCAQERCGTIEATHSDHTERRVVSRSPTRPLYTKNAPLSTAALAPQGRERSAPHAT